MEEELYDFANWLIDNRLRACETAQGHRWRQDHMGSVMYTTEELVHKFINEEEL